jgi:general stress protein 26
MTLINDDQGLFFATDAGTQKMAQLEENPHAEFLIQLKEGENNGYIRCECVAEVIHNRRLIARLFSENDFIGKLWKGPEDPALAIVRLKAKAYYLLEPGKWAVETIKLDPGTE